MTPSLLFLHPRQILSTKDLLGTTRVGDGEKAQTVIDATRFETGILAYLAGAHIDAFLFILCKGTTYMDRKSGNLASLAVRAAELHIAILRWVHIPEFIPPRGSSGSTRLSR